MKVSMIGFAQTGQMGPARLGMTHADLRAALGEPDAWGTQKTAERARIWLYGNIEFHFHDWRIVLIHADNFDVPTLGDAIELDPWRVRRGMTRGDWEAALAEKNIGFSIERNEADARHVDVVTEGGVRFSFLEAPPDEFTDEVPGLCCFHAAPCCVAPERRRS